ncbi:hemerythrin domain-containing protein [Methylorubrum aminovorans]
MPAGTVTDLGRAERRKREGLDIPDRGLLADPLEYLLVDHLRMRDLCAVAERIAEGDGAETSLAHALAHHLVGDLAVHGLDDEEDLYPLVRRRAWPEDRVEDVLGALASDQALGERLFGELAEDLTAMAAAGSAPDVDLRRSLRDFAVRLRRRIAVENALVMPLAEARLTKADLAGLARRMAARRGMRLAVGAAHA